MKKFLFASLFAATALPAAAQQQQGFQTEAMLIFEDEEPRRVWITAATKTAVRYRQTAVAVDTVDIRRSELKSVYILEPRAFTEALDLFQARKYKEAKEMFVELKTLHQPVEALPGNYSALAGFYELECLRKLGDLEGLAAALQGFNKEGLMREHQLRQIEIYIFWDAVRTKNWQRIDSLAKEREAERLPGYQRAQIAYCHGLALEALERPSEALDAFNTAMIADAGASEEIARQAALGALRVYAADATVKDAARAWGKPNENVNSPGRARLLEAGALARLYELSLGGGTPLPKEFKDYPQYKPAEAKAG